MRYEYRELALYLSTTNDCPEVYYLKDLLMYALDYSAGQHCLSPEKEKFCRALIDILDEDKGR